MSGGTTNALFSFVLGVLIEPLYAWWASLASAFERSSETYTSEVLPESETKCCVVSRHPFYRSVASFGLFEL